VGSYQVIAIPVGYLLGAFPSALIVGRIAAGFDIRIEGDGRISAAAVYRRFGIIPFLLVVCLDVGKGALAVFIASIIESPFSVMLLSGIAAVIGHCWSVFLKFKGGQGATVIYGVLASLVFWQFLVAGSITGLFLLVTRRPGWSTILLITMLSIILLATRSPFLLTIYPITLITFMVIKRLQIRKIINNAGVIR
jgi:glycerol-3-phosphate acyltransferase PlsY